MNMSIKEHIEAGHYPVDEKGRALVPLKNGDTATILATDRDPDGERETIVGWLSSRTMYSWWGHGEHSRKMPSQLDLLPPPPRKVKVSRWALYSYNGSAPNGGPWFVSTLDTRPTCAKGEIAVELTGEYEEPWS